MEIIKIIIEKTSTGYSAYSSNYHGVFTAGVSLTEIKSNIEEVINLQSDYFIEKGDKEAYLYLKNASVIYFLDIIIFFEEFPMFNQTELAKYIGLNGSHLRKLKNGLMKLSTKKSKQIEDALHKLGMELCAVNLVI